MSEKFLYICVSEKHCRLAVDTNCPMYECGILVCWWAWNNRRKKWKQSTQSSFMNLISADLGSLNPFSKMMRSWMKFECFNDLFPKFIGHAFENDDRKSEYRQDQIKLCWLLSSGDCVPVTTFLHNDKFSRNEYLKIWC